jgi:hypothetical protein
MQGYVFDIWDVFYYFKVNSHFLAASTPKIIYIVRLQLLEATEKYRALDKPTQNVLTKCNYNDPYQLTNTTCFGPEF